MRLASLLIATARRRRSSSQICQWLTRCMPIWVVQAWLGWNGRTANLDADCGDMNSCEIVGELLNNALPEAAENLHKFKKTRKCHAE